MITGMGAMYFLESTNKDKDDELATLRPQAAEISELKKENAELKKVESQSDEVARLKKENVDLLKLRNEVGRLRSEKIQMAKQLQSTRSQAEKFQAMASQKEWQLRREQDELEQQRKAAEFNKVASTPEGNAKLQIALVNACINNLRQMDGAKQQWALENKKTDQSVPTEKEVADYLKDSLFPKCPAGGTYSIKAVNADPTCSIPGHQLPTP